MCMPRRLSLLLGLFCVFLFLGTAHAHFGMVIPSKSTVMTAKDADIGFSLKFWHPFANTGMNLEKPKSFQVIHDGNTVDLLPSLREAKEQGHVTWQGSHTVKKPGLYTFVMEPMPYFEKEEDCFIVHLTKVYVDAFGDDEGWDAPLGLKTEIVPLSRPGALYAGNVFRGQVLTDGKPVSGAEVEVEWYPGPDLRGVAPAESMITQTVKADSEGIFVFAAPQAGWWGFAALQDADYTLKHEETEKTVELGAVLWVEFHKSLPPVPLKGTSKK